jgi:AAA domain
MRKRTQVGMVRIYDALIDRLNRNAGEVPSGWSGLVDDVDDEGGFGSPPLQDETAAALNPELKEVFFPLAANREQRRIVEAINRQRGVLVQGPPGTGKSHTIANLVCHLLASEASIDHRGNRACPQGSERKASRRYEASLRQLTRARGRCFC